MVGVGPGVGGAALHEDDSSARNMGPSMSVLVHCPALNVYTVTWHMRSSILLMRGMYRLITVRFRSEMDLRVLDEGAGGGTSAAAENKGPTSESAWTSDSKSLPACRAFFFLGGLLDAIFGVGEDRVGSAWLPKFFFFGLSSIDSVIFLSYQMYPIPSHVCM